jgi:hypothetical protein
MKKRNKIFIIVTSVLAIGGLGYIGYTLLRINALNKKISTTKEVEEAIIKVAQENPNAEVEVTEEQIDAAEDGMFGNNGDVPMDVDFSEITDEEIYSYLEDDFNNYEII